MTVFPQVISGMNLLRLNLREQYPWLHVGHATSVGGSGGGFPFASTIKTASWLEIDFFNFLFFLYFAEDEASKSSHMRFFVALSFFWLLRTVEPGSPPFASSQTSWDSFVADAVARGGVVLLRALFLGT